ncbi:MAG TPA: hypothetical protein PK544_02335 [Spirochaetota bacterium]|nr:hypothetical protein [Spirochaetota bacterium]HPQ53690.1 hypothetical protein [Spirochaetota bacterium]
MAITKAEKAAYNDYITEFKRDIDESLKRIKDAELKIKKMPRIAPYKKLEMVLEYLKIIMLYVSMNDASVEMLQIKKESSLNEGRKNFYKVLQLMEDLVGTEVDRPLGENDEYLVQIEKVNPLQILRFLERINHVYSTLMDRMGEGSKWKWSFVDIKGRIAVVTKNIISFSDTQRLRDPRSEYYVERRELMSLCKASLKEAAQQFRSKYEQSTKATSDLLNSIELLTALRKIHVLFGETDDAKKIKNTIDALRQRVEEDEKQKEKDTGKAKKK